jgi:Protein of unknown function (DUF2934)
MDVSMCAGGDCPKKTHCLRFTAAVYGRQDFFGTPPYLSDPTRVCPYFMDDRPSEAAIRTEAYLFWERDGCPDGQSEAYWMQAEAYLLARKRNGG